MLCSLVVRLKRKGNYFKWIEILISSLVLSLTFQFKANDCVWTNFVYLFTCSIFGAFSAGRKCTLYTGKYGIVVIINTITHTARI